MTRVQLEKKFNVQIDEVRSVYLRKKIGWVAYRGDTEVARKPTIADLEKQLVDIFQQQEKGL